MSRGNPQIALGSAAHPPIERARGLRAEPVEVDALAWFPPEVVDAWLARRPEDFSPVFGQVWQLARSDRWP